MSKNISRVRGNFPYSAAGEAGCILGLSGPHAARRPYVVHPCPRTIQTQYQLTLE